VPAPRLALLLTALAALLVPARPAAGPAATSVVVFPALGRPTLVAVTGRVVRGEPEKPGTPLARNARRLLAKSREHVPVSVTFAGQTRQVATDDDGLFTASFPAPAEAPFPPGRQAVRAEAEGAAGAGQVEVVSDAAPFLVVSDLDDTLAVTNVQSTRGLLGSALLADERTQAAVEGMAAFFRCLRDGNDPTPGFVIVSGSPLEYGPRVEAFLAKAGFPFAALVLRHLGPGTVKGYKEPALRALLSGFPQRVVLVGDSGERDPEIYAQLRREFPGRVAAVFIHDVGRSEDAARFEGMVLFASAADAARAAAAGGLLAPACAEAAFPRPAPAPAPP
jgi:phosphatidate phosphatase APP1